MRIKIKKENCIFKDESNLNLIYVKSSVTCIDPQFK